MVRIIKINEIPRDRIASERRRPESPSLGNFSGFIAGVNMKKCGKCKKVKKLSEFFKRTISYDGLMGQCKLCKKEYDQKPEVKARTNERQRGYNKTPEAKAKRWEYEHRPEVAARRKVYINTPKMVTYRRNINFKRKYSISLEQYRAMVTKQNSVCSICGLPETRKRENGLTRLAVDHCHDTNKVRGLLCNNCNLAIGYFGDNIDVMASAVSYLRQSG